MAKSENNSIMKKTPFVRGIKFVNRLARKNGPKYACIQLTTRCNMRCSFCGFWSEKAIPDHELKLSDYQKLADELADEYGLLLTTLEGGEPFVRKDLVEIVRIFGERHMPILYTNGWFVTEELAKALFDAGLHKIGVSIDYPDAERHDRKRGTVGAWGRAWKAVELLKNAAPYGGTQVSVLTVFMKDNQNELERMLQLSQDKGVGHEINLLSLQGFHRAGQSENELPELPVSAGLLELWEKYPHFRTFRDYLKNIDHFVSQAEMPACLAGRAGVNVGETGEISPCIEKVNHTFGNIKSESFSKIYDRLNEAQFGKDCQCCWTLCRGLGQVMGDRTNFSGWKDLVSRMQVN